MLGWLVRRRAQPGAGELLWVDREGAIHSLGVYTPDDLASLRWGVEVAYRVTRDRSERTRLARVRLVAHALAQGVAKAKASSSKGA